MTQNVSFISKGEMLDAIKSHLNMSKNADFARFLGISSQAVSNWYTRNTFDAELLYTKCDFINPAWLLTGKGSMLKDDLDSIKSIPLHDRLSFLIEATNDVHVVAQSLGIEETSLLNCTNNFLEPKEEIDFNKFLTEFPEFSKQWLLQGIGTPFDGKDEEDTKELIKERVFQRGLQEKNKTIEESLARKTSNQQIGIPLVPLSAMAGAFTGETSVMEYECERYVIPAFKGADFLIQIKGDSMQPTYYSGDLVACQRMPLNDIFFQWNKAYVLDTVQGPLIKRIMPGSDADHVLIVSDNSNYPPFELHKNQFNGVALVRGLVRLE